MHALLLTFTLADMTADEWISAEGPRLAPAFANLPGLLSKVWLADPDTNTFGGIYFWDERGDADRFLSSDLAEAARQHPNLKNLSARRFEVLSELTRLTQPVVEIVRAGAPV